VLLVNQYTDLARSGSYRRLNYCRQHFVVTTRLSTCRLVLRLYLSSVYSCLCSLMSCLPQSSRNSARFHLQSAYRRFLCPSAAWTSVAGRCAENCGSSVCGRADRRPYSAAPVSTPCRRTSDSDRPEFLPDDSLRRDLSCLSPTTQSPSFSLYDVRFVSSVDKSYTGISTTDICKLPVQLRLIKINLQQLWLMIKALIPSKPGFKSLPLSPKLFNGDVRKGMRAKSVPCTRTVSLYRQ